MPAERTVGRTNVTRAVIVAVILELLGNAAGIAIGYVTGRQSSSIVVALTVVGASVVTGLAVVFVPRLRAESPAAMPSPQAPHGPYGPAPTAPVRARGTASAVTAVLVLLLLCGVGGTAATYGVQWGAMKIRTLLDPTSEPGTERLAEQRSATNGHLTINVISVEVNSQVTMVGMAAHNSGNETLTLPVFGNTQFTLVDGATLEGNPSHSEWPNDVPPGGTITGRVVFDGVPDPAETEASLSFTHVFGLGGPESITVSGIRLTAVDQG